MFTDANAENLIKLVETENEDVSNNIFKRFDENPSLDEPGTIRLNEKEGTRIDSNIIGRVNESAANLGVFSDAMQASIAKFEEAFGDEFGLDAGDQFGQGLWFNGGDVNPEVTGNIINLATEANFDFRYVTYLKGHEGLVMDGNHFSGGPDTGVGGVRVRNSDGPTTISDNIFDGTPLVTATFKSGSSNVPEEFKRADIVGNRFEFEEGEVSKAAIWYRGGDFADSADLRIFANEFEIPGNGDNAIKANIGGSSDGVTSFFVEGNRTADGGEVEVDIPANALSTTFPDADRPRLEAILDGGDTSSNDDADIVNIEDIIVPPRPQSR